MPTQRTHFTHSHAQTSNVRPCAFPIDRLFCSSTGSTCTLTTSISTSTSLYIENQESRAGGTTTEPGWREPTSLKRFRFWCIWVDGGCGMFGYQGKRQTPSTQLADQRCAACPDFARFVWPALRGGSAAGAHFWLPLSSSVAFRR